MTRVWLQFESELNLHLILPRDVTDDSQHVTLHVPFDARDQGFHQRGIAHEDAEGCHTDQHVVSGGLHETEMLQVPSAPTDFCYISEVLHRNAETAESS